MLRRILVRRPKCSSGTLSTSLVVPRRFHNTEPATKETDQQPAMLTKPIPRSGGDAGATHFGFQTIDESEKEEKVHKVFEEVAQSYDLMNDAMSAGIHRIWKDAFMERLGPAPGTRLLDMAGGTGDIAFRYINYINARRDPSAPEQRRSHVTIGDINQHMLDVGRKRAERLGYCEPSSSQVDENGGSIDSLTSASSSVDVSWACANAEKLPFDDDTFTAYTIAFGIRNCTHIDRVLSEAYRVLRPGGRFMCLEFSQLNSATLQWLYDQYSFTMIPPMGQLLAGQWQPYQYLVESIRKFPPQEDFKRMIESAGFAAVDYENLTAGVCSIHSGFKL